MACRKKELRESIFLSAKFATRNDSQKLVRFCREICNFPEGWHRDKEGTILFRLQIQGDPSPGEPGLGYFDLGCSTILLSRFCQNPTSPSRIGHTVEQSKSKSTQPRFARWVTLYTLGRTLICDVFKSIFYMFHWHLG